MPKKIEIAIISAYDAKGSTAAAKALADLNKSGAKGAGLSAAAAKDAQALAKVATAAAQASTAQAKLATETQKAAGASNTAAVSAQRLATEQQRTAIQAANAARAQTQASAAALRYAQAQSKAADSGNYFKQVGDGVTSSIMGVVGPVAVATAAFGAATATVQSFADAFQFKAQLDATTLSINAQLQGVRDSGQVWNEASAFAQKFKLTQQETTQAIAASIGVMRASKAPVEDILGVLARMQVLSPEQSLEEAAIALKALASGDTTSLVTRFEVGRDVANQMKQEIQGGADAVAVMSQFLGGVGIGMDVLAAKTEGASGKFKDLAIAQEDLKLAQADFAQGPGLVILETQIRAVSGATRLLSGDFEAMGQSLHNAVTGGSEGAAQMNADMDRLQGVQAETGVTAAVAADAQNAYTRAILEGGTEAEAAAARDAVLASALATTGQATQVVTDIELQRINVQVAATAATQAHTQATTDAATQTLIDAAAKAEDAAQTELLTAQTNAAVSAFLLLHPNISASGVASLAAAGQITPLLAQLIQATLRAREAASALAAFNALQGVKATRVVAGEDRREVEGYKHAAVEADRSARARVSAAQYAAEKERTLAVGTSQQKTALLQNEYNAAVKMYGAGSTQAYQAQTKILQATEKGSAARGASAGAAATKLEGIETKTGDKLAQIVQDTQAKLIAIDQKAAAERARIAADLANKIATTAADRRASNEADDLDLIGVTDEKEAAKLNDREKAQAAAREREVAAAKEAQDAIANGEAESASKVYDIRETQIGKQQELDEKYAERQRELAGNEEAQAALKQQYDEGTRANEEAAATRIAIAKAESEQKKAEVQAEKDAVIAAANEQANQVVSAAERSAAGVSKATGTARATAVANLKAIGDAVTAIPSQKTITISVNQQGSVGASSAGGGGGGPKAAGGGNFMTNGPTRLLVGDNPGGRELVTVTPLSGTGQTRMGGGLIALAGGGTVDAGGGYTTPIAGGGGGGSKGGGGGGKGGGAAVDAKKALDEMKNTISLLMDMAKLKEQIAALAGVPAFDIPIVQALIARAQEFTAAVNSHLVPLTKAEGESLGRYLSAAKDAASLIGDMASLKKDIAALKNVPAFDQATVLALIDRAEQFTKAVQGRLIPLTEFERDQIGRYTQVVGDVVGMLKDVADLKKELAEPSPPIDIRYIDLLIADAATVTVLMRGRLIGTTEEQADAVGLYASVVGDTVSILNDVIDLGKNLKESGGRGAISDQLIIALADQAMRITTLVSERLIPATEAQNEAASAYADLVGSSVSALADVAGLSGKLFADYVSPTDAQLALLATDAQRVTAAFFQAGQVMGKEGAEAGKVYAEGVGAVFGAVKDGLEVFDRLRFADISVDPKNLALLHDSSLMVLDTVRAIGAQAATIPPGDIAAMNSATGAIKSYSEAMVTLAAVPFADLPRAAGAFGASGAGSVGGGGITVNIYNPPAGMNVPAVIQQVKTGLSQQTARRY